MSIYHLHAQVIKRSAGKSSTAAAAYRAGEKIKDEKSGEIHDYTKKSGVVHSEIVKPHGTGKWIKSREQLWNDVEKAENRKDAQLAREFDIALPKELNKDQQIELVRDFAKRTLVGKGMVADISIHHPEKDPPNPHAHIMTTMREATREGFGKKNREWNDRKVINEIRKSWEQSANRALKEAGIEEQIKSGRTCSGRSEHIGKNRNYERQRSGEINITSESEKSKIRTDRENKNYAYDNFHPSSPAWKATGYEWKEEEFNQRKIEKEKLKYQVEKKENGLYPPPQKQEQKKPPEPTHEEKLKDPKYAREYLEFQKAKFEKLVDRELPRVVGEIRADITLRDLENKRLDKQIREQEKLLDEQNKKMNGFFLYRSKKKWREMNQEIQESEKFIREANNVVKKNNYENSALSREDAQRDKTKAITREAYPEAHREFMKAQKVVDAHDKQERALKRQREEREGRGGRER